MKISLLLLALSLSMGLIGQNKKDAKGKRIGHWKFYGKDRIFSNYPANALVEEGNFVNGFKEGVWIKYFPDGKTKKLEGNYVNNRPMGQYTRYHKNGVIMEKGNFSRKNFSGPYARYYKNGNLSYSCTFDKQGKETGSVKHYHLNGTLAMEYTAQDGMVLGKMTKYYENGSVQEIREYGDKGQIAKVEKFKPVNKVVSKPIKEKKIVPPHVDKPNTRGATFNSNGNNRIYNENDAIWMDGMFRNGQLWDGKVFDYDSNGILIKVRLFKNGVYHSDTLL